MARFKEAIIDLDIPVYKSAAAGQKTIYHLYNSSGEHVGEFTSAKDCKAYLEDLEEIFDIDTTGYTRESEVRIGDFETCTRVLDHLVEHYIKVADAEKGLFSIGGGSRTFRDDIAVSKIYKGNRTQEKPHYFKRLREYAIEKYNPKVVTGIESDDQISIWLYESYLKGLKSRDKNKCTRIMVDLEKDCRTTPSWHIDPEKDDEPVWISTLDANRWCLTQSLAGDQADHYAGCKGVGYKTAEKILRECKTTEEMWNKARETFIEKGHSEEYMVEMCRLAFMLREGDIEEDWKVLKGG